jgi:hypothetical protein
VGVALIALDNSQAAISSRACGGQITDMPRREHLSLLERPPPPGFELRLLHIEPLGSHPYRSGEWCDALVVIERGEVELERLDGSLWPFASGAVLWLAGLPLRALHNPGAEPALLASVCRRTHAERASGGHVHNQSAI